jgi:hypothetical protein
MSHLGLHSGLHQRVKSTPTWPESSRPGPCCLSQSAGPCWRCSLRGQVPVRIGDNG